MKKLCVSICMFVMSMSLYANDLNNQIIVGWEGVLPPSSGGTPVVDLGPSSTNTSFIPTEVILRNYNPAYALGNYLDFRNSPSGNDTVIMSFVGNRDFLPAEVHNYQFFPMTIKPADLTLGNDIITGNLYVGNGLNNSHPIYIEVLGYVADPNPSN